MSQTSPTPRRAETPPRWEPAAPSLAMGPGLLLLLAGVLLLSGGGPAQLGWACVVLGQALFLVGAVAKGVAWGLELHKSGRD
jgi:hypothetical protein